MLMAEAIESAIAKGGELTGEKVRDGFYVRQNWVPKGFEGVCNPSNFTPEDHRGTLKVALYRAVVAGDTSSGTVQELMASGAMKLQPVATVELERKRELLGW
jgi:branched-chain amino acid transport system substrate-binding protein